MKVIYSHNLAVFRIDFYIAATFLHVVREIFRN